MPEVDSEVRTLVAEVLIAGRRGCKVKYIENTKALQFITAITETKQSANSPSITKAEELLKEHWGIDLPRRALSEHVRGKCGCRKK